MVNLEELKLCLYVVRLNSTYLDGIQLYDQFLIYMTQLNNFTFSINTEVRNRNVTVEFPSNDDIERSFFRREYQRVVSYVHTNSTKTGGKCHIYSLPYEFEYFVKLDIYFQGGMFQKVRYLTMNDTHPFEYKVFKRISQDFSFLEFLRIINGDPIKDKQHSSILITFPYLKLLDIKWTHFEYAELFLLERNTHLPRLVNLSMKYTSLITITNNFTNDATHFNFGTLKCLDLCQSFVRPENFHQYFPLL
jgi:hypothetical protein